MENGSESREEKEAVIEHDEQLNGNGAALLGDEVIPSAEWVDERNLETDSSSQQKPVDYSRFNKNEFVGLLKEAATKNDFKRADDLIREIKPLYDNIRQLERTEALIRFKESAGIEGDFEYKGDEWDHAFA